MSATTTPEPSIAYELVPTTSVVVETPIWPGAKVNVKVAEELAAMVAGNEEVSSLKALLAYTWFCSVTVGVFIAADVSFARVKVMDEVALVETFPKLSGVELFGWRVTLPEEAL
jgi:hypothetical protein